MGSRMLVLLLSAFVLGQSARAADPHFFESFSTGLDKWVASADPKFSGKLEAATPPGFTDDQAAKVTEKARHYGLSRVVDKPIDPADGLVLQYEVKLADGLTCGGAYLKFLTASEEFDASGLVDNTPYVVMFGPDKCGSTNKVHLILQHQSPSGEIEEKHLKTPPMVPLDSDTHVFTAILQSSDNTYEVLVDGESKKSGSLFEDFEPPFNPPEEIDDPEDKKPEDWVEQAKIADPDAVKPDDWDEEAPREIQDADAEKPEGWLDDEPEEVDDPEAEKPDDWDDEEDGEWEPPKITNPKCTEGPGCGEWKRPTIPNPAYKGKWNAPLIDNPEYKGPWKPRTIPNPNYFLDEEPLKNIGKIGGVAIEIWTMDDNYYFDNILVASDAAAAEEARQTYWQPKKAVEEEVKAKEKEEIEKKAAAEADAKSIGEYITGLFDLPGLSALRGPLEPALEFIEENDWAAYASAAILSSIPLFLVFTVLAPKSKVKKAATATIKEVKKQDKPTPDDTPAAAANSEIVDDEDEEDEKKGVRRRARRD